VINVEEREVNELERASKLSSHIRIQGERVAVYRRGGPISHKMLAFDLAASEALEDIVPVEKRPAAKVAAEPSVAIGRSASVFTRKHDLSRRVGIRVRVTECPADGRKPRRLKADLDQTVKSIIRLPWYTRVFVVTDSEYVQQMLASHFLDTTFLPKRFGDRGACGRYVHRHDPLDMRSFVTEIACLAGCWKIVNIGGVINQDTLCKKMIAPPFERWLGDHRQLMDAGVVTR
jgi:hypothetical protein